jgi:hypothetical protein
MKSQLRWPKGHFSAIRSIAYSLGTNGSDRTAAVRRSRGVVTRSTRQIDFRYQECRLGSFSPPPYSDAKDLSPRIGTFGPTGTLCDLIHRPVPAYLCLLERLLRVRACVMPHSLTRTRQRSRCLEVGNRFIRSLTALAIFVIAGKAPFAIDLVRQRVKFAYACTRFIGGLVQLSPMDVLGFGPPTLLRADRGSQFYSFTCFGDRFAAPA